MRRECARRGLRSSVGIVFPLRCGPNHTLSLALLENSRRGARQLHVSSQSNEVNVVPLRKQLKDLAKASKVNNGIVKPPTEDVELQNWELTVGIEIHAQLNTARKLFSSAPTRPTEDPNSQLAYFDLSLPGSQPLFQYGTLIPAIRAAIALDCKIQPVSKFDRKHYFYHDQPSGYQITQYYHPFAKDGSVRLDTNDGLDDGEHVLVGIKQIQMEQDTARTQEQDNNTSLIDFNRAGHPLIEIISLPHIHTPKAASAYVRKVQALLFAVDAVTTGMEMGGLRADVNVSVRRKDGPLGLFAYSGVTGLGQRIEIKNLSSFKGIEDAIIAERDRQITILDAGEVVKGETRGWSLTDPNVTRRLRGKEGEVDYRYMPDPDIPPLRISSEVIEYMSETLPPTPGNLLQMLVQDYGLSSVDGKALLSLNDGQRVLYFQEVIDHVEKMNHQNQKSGTKEQIGRIVGNWVLHELGSVLSRDDRPWNPETVPSQSLARVIYLQTDNQITNTSAKEIIRVIYDGDATSVDEIVEREGLTFASIKEDEYQKLALEVMNSYPDHVKDIQEKNKHGKIMFLVGQMMRLGDRGRIQATEAEKMLRKLILSTN